MSNAPSFRPADIRNVVLLGHAGAGKTTLAEAILHRCGQITRMGSVDAENTVSDFEPEAKAHHHSTNSNVLFATHEGKEINVIDTPGSPEFVGHALSALPAVETALVVINATQGIEFNARRLFHAAGEAGLSRMIVVNRIDENLTGLPALVADLRETFGAALHCINLPTAGGTDVIDCFDHEAGEADFGDVGQLHMEMLESSVEIDDEALERYLGGEAIDLPDLRRCFVEAMNQGHVVPILFTAAKTEVGVDDLLHILVEEGASPVSGRSRRVLRDGTRTEIACDADAPLLAQVFKTTTDPYVGKLSLLRILQGKLDGTTPFVCGADRRTLRAGHVLKVEGRDHPEMDATAYAGDLVAIAKIDDLRVDTIVHDPALGEEYRALHPVYPKPMYSLALRMSRRADEAKLGGALARLAEEDPTFEVAQETETQELVVSGIGELHLRVTLEKLKNRFGLEVEASEPTIAYRETITTKAEGHYRHKKQTGGAGQFGEVFLRVEPLPRGSGYEFVDDTFGGSIPHQFISSCDKGIQDALGAGVLGGFPVQDVRVTIYDGKSHAVDSKDIAFRTAAKFATRAALEKARPVLLEPLVSMEITTPERHLGDVTADLSSKRARILGVTAQPSGAMRVDAQTPLAELGQYAGRLRGLTSGQGTFVAELSHYDVLPDHLKEVVLADRAG